MTVGPALRVRAKMTVVEDPQASLPNYILYSTLCHAFTKTLEQSTTLLHFVFYLALTHFSLILFHCLMLIILPSFSASSIFPSKLFFKIWSMKSWFTFYYHNSTPFHFPLSCSTPCCLVLLCLLQADSSTNQDRSLSWSSVLGSYPSLPGQWPASVALLWELLVAVITSGIQALGLPHRWHGEWGWVHRVERSKGRIFRCSWQDDVRTAADLPATAGVRIKLYSLPCTPSH